MLNNSKSLTFVASLDKLFCILLHSGLEVTYYDDFNYQGPWAYMISTDSFRDLLQDVLGLTFVDALQVGHGEASFVQGVVHDSELGCPLPDFPGFLDVLWKSSILEEG